MRVRWLLVARASEVVLAGVEHDVLAATVSRTTTTAAHARVGPLAGVADQPARAAHGRVAVLAVGAEATAVVRPQRRRLGARRSRWRRRGAWPWRASSTGRAGRGRRSRACPGGSRSARRRSSRSGWRRAARRSARASRSGRRSRSQRELGAALEGLERRASWLAHEQLAVAGGDSTLLPSLGSTTTPDGPSVAGLPGSLEPGVPGSVPGSVPGPGSPPGGGALDAVLKVRSSLRVVPSPLATTRKW